MLTEQQKKERINFIGSSDIAAVLGISRYQTALGVWAEKTGLLPPRTEETLAMEVGKALEDTVANLFMKRTGKIVTTIPDTKYHPNYKFLAANLDRYVVAEDVPMECKVTSWFNAREWEGVDIPPEVIAQIQWQMAIVGAQYGYVACLIGGTHKFVHKRVERDSDLIMQMTNKAVDFWLKYVEPKVIPAMITSRDADTLYDLFPESKEEQDVALGEEANVLLDAIKSYEEDLRLLEGNIDKSKNEVKALMKEAAYAHTDRWRFSWKTQYATRLDPKLLREEMPDVFKSYSRTTGSRVFRKSEVNEEK